MFLSDILAQFKIIQRQQYKYILFLFHFLLLKIRHKGIQTDIPMQLYNYIDNVCIMVHICRVILIKYIIIN